VSSKSIISRLFERVIKTGEAKWRSHPLIYTPLKFTLAQNVESLKKRSLSSAVFFEK
jgi:hypothetical protein